MQAVYDAANKDSYYGLLKTTHYIVGGVGTRAQGTGVKAGHAKNYYRF